MYQSAQTPQALAHSPSLGNPVVPVAYSRFSFWQPRSPRIEPRAQPAESLDLDQRVRQSGEW